MQIVQLLPTLAFGDAVGNDAIALAELLSKMGHKTLIYAENIDPKIDKNIVKHYSFMPQLTAQDIIIYHFSTGSKVMEKILQSQAKACRKIMIYHNITPGHFFDGYNDNLAELVKSGRDELRKLQNFFDFCIADSHFNKQDLQNMGYTCPIEVVPILIPLQDYEKTPNNELINHYKSDGHTNILFVGRVVPNKKQEDIIKAFAYYKRTIDDKARLFLVGNYSGMEIYYDRLRRYVDALGIKTNDIIFTGHTSFEDILAYYNIADVFLCMSEHEGFCVPLVEAMKFKIPIIATDAGAISETLSGAGVIIDEQNKNSIVIAQVIAKILSDESFKKNILNLENERLKYFSYESISFRMQDILTAFINNVKYSSGDSYTKNINYNIKAVVDSIREQALRNDESDNSIPFEKIPLISKERNEKKSIIELAIMKLILRPGHKMVAAVSPELANYIRNKTFGLIHRIKYGTPPENRIIIEKAISRNNKLLLIDVTETTKSDAGTGIQRVVNNIFKNINDINKNILPVRDWHEKLVTSRKYLDRIHKRKFEDKEQEVHFVSGDQLLLLDSSWIYYKDFSRIIKMAHKNETTINAIVYDMFPIQYPELFDSQYFIKVFEGWHNMLLKKADGIICISKTTANIVAKYYSEHKFKREKQLNLYYFHMGSDIPSTDIRIRKEIEKFVKQGPTLLMVGTVEPRKGYGCVLDAYEKILPKLPNIQLLVIGKNGWKNDDLLKILSKEIFKKNVLWVTDAKDDELHWAYQNAVALIAASRDEGFGLPIIEAAHFGLPIICSDIPIFREVAGDNATYFKVMDAESLADTIIKWINQPKHPDSKNIKLYTWKESAQEILDILNGKIKPYKILN